MIPDSILAPIGAALITGIVAIAVAAARHSTDRTVKLLEQLSDRVEVLEAQVKELGEQLDQTERERDAALEWIDGYGMWRRTRYGDRPPLPKDVVRLLHHPQLWDDPTDETTN